MRSSFSFLLGAILVANARGRRQSDWTAKLASRVTVEPQDASDAFASRTTAMSLAEAEETFMNWRAQFEQQKQPCPACRKNEGTSNEAMAPLGGTKDEVTSSFVESEVETHTEGRSDVNRSAGAPGRLAKAVFAAMVPEPAIATCLTMHINLAALNIPATLTISFRGEVAYGVCTRCFEWRIESDLAFKVGLEVLGYGLRVGFFVNGGVNLREQPCTDAPESSYCRFLHVFLPPELKKLTASNTRCHSESPFEALIAFIDFQWRKLRATAKGEKEVFVNEFHLKLYRYAKQLKKYPELFDNNSRSSSSTAGHTGSSMVETHSMARDTLDRASIQRLRQHSAASALDSGSQEHNSKVARAAAEMKSKSNVKRLGDRILVATCVNATGLPLPHHPKAKKAILDMLSQATHDPFCQLELGLADSTAEENYQRVYGGVGPRYEGDCNSDFGKLSNSFNTKSVQARCDNPDRCFWKPSLSKKRLCKFAPKFMGEIWRSSFLPNTQEPFWDEGHAFQLPDGSEDVMLYGSVYDWDEDGLIDLIGESLQQRITVKAGDDPLLVKLPLSKRLDSSDDTGFLFVSLRWIEPEGDGPEAGKLAGPLGAMSAAMEGFAGKLPDYAMQVETRLWNSDERERGINYKSLSGRYMARWLRADKREDIEDQEMTSIILGEYVEDPKAPKDDNGCVYRRAWDACYPTDYCERNKRMFSRKCKLKEFIMKPCKTELGESHCCDTGDGDACSDSTKMPCMIDANGTNSAPMVCTLSGATSIEVSDFQCSCNTGLCYDAASKQCLKPKGDCTRGSHEQQDRCRKANLRSEFHGRLSKATPGSPMANYLLRRYNEAEAMLHTSPCSTLPITSDERVVNFARALVNTHPTDLNERNNFYAELITSVANLFIRTVSDVQAMFNIYFANDPNWDDDCLSLIPSFENFYEFSNHGLKRRLGTQADPSPEWVTHRVKPRGTVEQIGRRINDKTNPWCQYSWAAGEKHPSQRVQFVHPHPPKGLTGFRTPERKLNGTMMPHLWCELVEGLRSSPEGEERPYGDVKYQRGKTLSFQAACSQLAFFEVVDSAGDPDGEFKFWRRYDCEQTILNSAFLTFFPTFVQQVEAAHKKIGAVLEDALQCAGRIDDDGREFPSGTEGLQRLCPVSVHDMLERKKETVRAKQDRTEFLAAKAQAAIELMKDWMKELSTSGPVLVSDFTRTWEFGERLTGLAYNAGEGIKKAYEVLGTQKAISERILSLEQHLVQKAWRSRGQTDRALFPPPVSYETTTTVGVYSTFGEERDICKVEMVPGLELAGRHKLMGVTYLPNAIDVEKYCMVGKFAPLPSIEISIQGCSRKVEIDEQEEKEISWSIGVRGILSVYDMMANGTRMRDAFTRRDIKRLDTDLMKNDNVTTSVPWVMLSSILKSPLSFFPVIKGGIGGTAALMTPVVLEVGKKIGADAIAAKAKELGTAVTEYVKGRLWAKFRGFELKSYRAVDMQLEFVKLGDGPYEPKFSVHYKHMMNAKRYDLSEVFSVVYHVLKGSKDEKLFQKCVRCLNKHHTVFCYNAATSSSRCTATVVDEDGELNADICNGSGEEEIVDVTDCGLTDGDTLT